MSGRRAAIIKKHRALKKKNGPPVFVVFERWAIPAGLPPVIIHIAGRKPTEKEVSDLELETLRQWVAEIHAERQHDLQSNPNPTPPPSGTQEEVR